MAARPESVGRFVNAVVGRPERNAVVAECFSEPPIGVAEAGHNYATLGVSVWHQSSVRRWRASERRKVAVQTTASLLSIDQFHIWPNRRHVAQRLRARRGWHGSAASDRQQGGEQHCRRCRSDYRCLVQTQQSRRPRGTARDCRFGERNHLGVGTVGAGAPTTVSTFLDGVLSGWLFAWDA